MDGTDWAYDVLVDIALAHSKQHVRLKAQAFRKDVLDACVGMACADIDHHASKKTVYAYETVRDVCMELTREEEDGTHEQREAYLQRLSEDVEAPSRDTGRYQGGYRTFRNGTCREDFGSDR